MIGLSLFTPITGQKSGVLAVKSGLFTLILRRFGMLTVILFNIFNVSGTKKDNISP